MGICAPVASRGCGDGGGGGGGGVGVGWGGVGGGGDCRDLWGAFPEGAGLAAGCRVGERCLHLREPAADCAVKARPPPSPPPPLSLRLAPVRRPARRRALAHMRPHAHWAPRCPFGRARPSRLMVGSWHSVAVAGHVSGRGWGAGAGRRSVLAAVRRFRGRRGHCTAGVREGSLHGRGARRISARLTPASSPPVPPPPPPSCRRSARSRTASSPRRATLPTPTCCSRCPRLPTPPAARGGAPERSGRRIRMADGVRRLPWPSAYAMWLTFPPQGSQRLPHL